MGKRGSEECRLSSYALGAFYSIGLDTGLASRGYASSGEDVFSPPRSLAVPRASCDGTVHGCRATAHAEAPLSAYGPLSSASAGASRSWREPGAVRLRPRHFTHNVKRWWEWVKLTEHVAHELGLEPNAPYAHRAHAQERASRPAPLKSA